MQKEAEIEFQPRQANDLLNVHASLPSLSLGIDRIKHGLDCTASGQFDCKILGHGASHLISQWGSTKYEIAMNAR